MSKSWDGNELAEVIRQHRSDGVVNADHSNVWISPLHILDIMRFLKEHKETQFDMLTSLTAVDYIDHFELVYRLCSLLCVTTAVIKSKIGFGRTKTVAPSVCSVWRGADYMEREVWDLMGVKFEDHPNLKRIMLWEGFKGHPLRKDFVSYDESLKGFEDLNKLEREIKPNG